jgi:tetratricopeptide (TPR) repeat protein
LELYLALAKAWEAAGEPEKALIALEDGERRLGSLIVLQLAAIDLQRRLHRWDSAVARVDRVAAQLERKETWLVRRAEILAEAGRYEEAHCTYQKALAAIHSLPPSLRQTKAMRDLEQQVGAALNSASTPGGCS